MSFWWVNQNQTFKQESEGGYLWSPKRNAHGGRNPFYEFMREVAPGDLVYSFEGTYIRAISIARSSAYEAPKPPEFGSAGPNWSRIGWRVDVAYHHLQRQIRPADWMHRIAPALPDRYAPLQRSGRGLQGVYLTYVPAELAHVLNGLIGPEVQAISDHALRLRDVDQELPLDTAVGLTQWEEHLITQVSSDSSIEETEREAVVMARRGQGRFKENVMRLERHCRITKVDRIEHLRASHIRPWRDCEDYRQRLDGENGFLLTPSIDHLFDRGFISFENNGELLISPAAHQGSLEKMGVQTTKRVNVGGFSQGQRDYLDYHRDQVFLRAQVNR